MFLKKEKTPFFNFRQVNRCTQLRCNVRTAECSGVQVVIVPEKGSAAINGDALKTSAGALHNILFVENSI